MHVASYMYRDYLLVTELEFQVESKKELQQNSVELSTLSIQTWGPHSNYVMEFKNPSRKEV